MTENQNGALPTNGTPIRHGAAEGFAVIGYAARFPGAADVEEFWEVLQQGRDAISEVPSDRWDV
ncbi:beta-ketoacyl synthase N-terminal-like domain-containing protein, partial [Mycobacterium sp. THU-M116]